MPEVTTIVLSGGASECAPATLRDFRGGSVRISEVVIADHVSYAQHSPRHLLHLPIASGVPGAGSVPRFTPADRDRRGWTDRGAITGLQLGFEDWFLEEACEQPLRATQSAASAKDGARAAVMAKMVAALTMSCADNRILYDTMLLALARQLGRTYGKVEQRRDDGWLHPRALSRVIERLHSREGPSLQLHDLAAEAGLGVSAFIRAFRGSVGTTPAAFAQRVRLNDASEMLRGSDLPIREIAVKCGFASASHFGSTFRARHGTTPARWRKGTRLD